MRILHTSDWHLGQNFYGKSRQAEHQAFLAWLLEQVEVHSLDTIIVAGDIFDTGSPPSYARALLNQFIDQLQDTQCQLVILGGNHDSVAMLNESKRLYSRLNSQLIANVTQLKQADSSNQTNFNHQVITLKNKQGQDCVQLCAVPFVRPRDVLISQAAYSLPNQTQPLASEKQLEKQPEKQISLLSAIEQHYSDLYQAAQQKNTATKRDLPIMGTGHLTVVNASLTDSVRDIYIGTLEAFPASAFPPFDYLALGHIHQPQQIGDNHCWRYSGSPIPMSFDEAKREKSVVLIHFPNSTQAEVKESDSDCHQSPEIELIPVPCFQPILTLKGDLAQIESQLKAQFLTQPQTLTSNLTSNPASSPSQCSSPLDAKITWLDIEITSRDFHSDIQQQVELICADYPVEILLVRRAKQKSIQTEFDQKQSLDELKPQAVFIQKLAEIELQNEQKNKLTQLFDMSLNQVIEQTQPNEHPDNDFNRALNLNSTAQTKAQL